MSTQQALPCALRKHPKECADDTFVHRGQNLTAPLSYPRCGADGLKCMIGSLKQAHSGNLTLGGSKRTACAAALDTSPRGGTDKMCSFCSASKLSRRREHPELFEIVS